jgi:phospholipid transport system substrate-binding protein
MLTRRILIVSVLAAGLSLAAPIAAFAETLQSARDFVDVLSQQTIETLTGGNVGDSQRIERFRKIFVTSVDMPVIGKLVMARHWRNATPEQQQEFLKLFEDVVVLTWSNRFKDAAGKVKLEVVDARSDVDQGIQVESRIVRDKQDPLPLIWKIRQTADGGFRVVDLVAEGTSMVFTYREEYASVINQRGGKVDGLLEELRKLVARLSSVEAAPAQ